MSELAAAWRSLGRLVKRFPGTGGAIVVSMALTLGLLSAVVSLFDSAFLRPWPMLDDDGLMVIDVTRRNSSGEVHGPFKWSYPDAADLMRSDQRPGEVAIYQWWPMSFGTESEPFRGQGMFVSRNYFEVLGLRPAKGRFFSFTRDDTTFAAVLSHGTWKRRFAADPDIVGRTIFVKGQALTVIGVGPPSFRGTEVPVDVDLWLPIESYRQLGPFPEWFEVRGTSFFTALTRRKPKLTREVAESRLQAFTAGLEAEYPKAAEGLGVWLRPLIEASFAPGERQRHQRYGEALLVGSGLILLVGFANVVHLFGGLLQRRRAEWTLRWVLGARKQRIVWHWWLELTAYLAFAGLLAWPFGWSFLRFLSLLRPPGFPEDLFTGAFDGGLLVALWCGQFGVSSLLLLVYGWRYRFAAPSDGSRSSVNRLPWLVVTQVALAAMALVAAMLYLRALQRLQEVPLGFDSDRILVASFAPGEMGLDDARVLALYRQIEDAMGELPEVEVASWSENRLLRGARWQRTIFRPTSPDPWTFGSRSVHRTNVVTPGFFATVGIPFVAGKDFKPGLSVDAPRQAIINRTMADALWPNRDAVGQHFRFDDGATGPQLQVVGVVEDAKYRHLDESPQAFVYLPLAQNFKPGMTLHVRCRRDPSQVADSARQLFRRSAPDVPVSDLAPLDDFVAEDLWLDRASAIALASFGVLTWLVAVLGIYGVLSQAVTQRRREFGIRRALGARSSHSARSLLNGLAPAVALGLAGGVLGSFFMLKGATARDHRWVDLLDASGVLVLLAMLLVAVLVGALVPFLRARRIRPAGLLRD